MRCILALLVAVCAFLFTPTSYACDCNPPDSPHVALQSSDAVFIGRVISLQLDSGNYRYRVTFRVSGYWKGVTEPIITILTPSQESECGFSFLADSNYLVYAYSYLDSLFTGICSRTVILSGAAFDLSDLGPPTPMDSGAASKYFPLHLGYQWSFTQNSSVHTERVTDTARALGHLYYGLTTWGTTPSFWFRCSGESVFVIEAPTDTEENLLYRFDANIGDTIFLPSRYACTFGTAIILAARGDTISTPVGTFSDCFHFIHRCPCADAGIQETWIARAVGRVLYSEESFAGLFTYGLASYNVSTSVNATATINIPSSCGLYDNYPNPFNPQTDIRYQISDIRFVTLRVYDLLGREVSTLVNETKYPGSYSVRWDAGNLATGVYLCRLTAGSFTQTRRMLLLR